MKRLDCVIATVAVATVIGALPPRAVLAQEPPVTLQQAIGEALRNNRRLGIAAAGVAQAEAGTREAKAQRLPRVDLAYQFQRTNNPVFVFGNLLRQGSFGPGNFDVDRLNNPDPISNFTPTLSIQQPLWTGGGIGRRVEAAELEVQTASLRQARTRQQVVFDTVEAYSGAVLAARHLAVAQEARATAQAHVELTQHMRDAGLVVDSDVLQAQVRASEAQEAVVRARSGLAVAKTALNFVIGRDLSGPITLPADLEELDEPSGAEEPLESLIQQALANRSDLQATARQGQAVAKSLEAERAQLLPQVGLSGFVESNAGSVFGHQSSNWGIMVGASFTIFDGNFRGAAVDRRRAQRRQVHEQELLLRRAIGLEVTQAFHAVRAATERVEQAEAAIELARENLRIVENRYREGLSTSVETLEAQTALTRSRTRAVAARRDLMLGRARLDLAIGR